MKSTDIFSIWESFSSDNNDGIDLSPDKIREILKPRINKSQISVKINIVTYLLVQLSAIIILSHNLSIFRSNDTLLLITASMLILSIAFLIYGFYTYQRLNKSDYAFRDLLEAVRNKLRLFRINVEIWLWFCSASLIILIMAINMMTDNMNGTYRINNTSLFIVILSSVFIFIYVINKFSLIMTIRRYKDFYTDLINNALDKLEARERWLKKHRTWLITGIVLIFGIMLSLFILGIIKSG